MEAKWVYLYEDIEPSVSGWYATQYCWDETEGIFVGANLWRVKDEWYYAYPITAWAGPFETQKEAEDWAYDNDPDC